MPSCNLVETIHNKWLQQSSNRDNDLYVATIDDFIQALMLVVRSYQYIKGEYTGKVVILGVRRLTGGCSGRARGRACPLHWARTGWAFVKKKFTVPNLLYY
jgi:hypothetical protein